MGHTISIHCLDREGKLSEITVAAKIIGALAVHAAAGVATYDGKPSFSITHLATGRRATPLYFETSEAAEAVAEMLVRLPVDWSLATFEDSFVREHLVCAVKSISALFGGYLIDSTIDHPAEGTA